MPIRPVSFRQDNLTIIFRRVVGTIISLSLTNRHPNRLSWQKTAETTGLGLTYMIHSQCAQHSTPCVKLLLFLFYLTLSRSLYGTHTHTHTSLDGVTLIAIHLPRVSKKGRLEARMKRWVQYTDQLVCPRDFAAGRSPFCSTGSILFRFNFTPSNGHPPQIE